MFSHLCCRNWFLTLDDSFRPTIMDFTNSEFPRNDTRLRAMCSLDYLHKRGNSKGHQKTQCLIQKFQIQFQNVLILTLIKQSKRLWKRLLILCQVRYSVLLFQLILEGRSLLLSSPSQPDRTLAYLLPLIQLLRRDREFGLNSKHPGVVVLCASEEKVE